MFSSKGLNMGNIKGTVIYFSAKILSDNIAATANKCEFVIKSRNEQQMKPLINT